MIAAAAYTTGGAAPFNALLHAGDTREVLDQLVGKALPHNSIRQYDVVKKIKRDQLQPGDLIFYYRDLHHVGIYIGDGRMIHAPTFGEKVRIDMVDELPVRGYGRVA